MQGTIIGGIIMNEDFVGYDLAVKLKEKGFNEPCYGYYHLNGGDDSFELCGNDSFDFLNSLNRFRIAAPFISQVLKWLRNQNIYVEVVVDDDSEEPLTYNIHVNNEYVLHHHGEYFSLKDWTKCELAGIEYVLDNLI